MTAPHFIVTLKIATYVGGLVGAVIWAVDPTIKVALIVSIPSMITGCGTLLLAFLNRSDAKKSLVAQDSIRLSVDGINSRLEDKLAAKNIQLSAKTEEAARAAGRREGSEEERGKLKTPVEQTALGTQNNPVNITGKLTQ